MANQADVVRANWNWDQRSLGNNWEEAPTGYREDFSGLALRRESRATANEFILL